jgi:16S rRNA (cytosine967-C5)-methyltransferase
VLATTPSMIRSSGLPPRRAALRILGQVREGVPFEAALDRAIDALPPPDRRLAHELAAGVLRQRSVLDAQLAPLIPRGWSGVVPELQDILRLGAYQLTALERVPPHAAVDTSVALAKKVAGARGASFVNAVLRRLARATPAEPSAAVASVEELAAQYSHPEWLVERWIEAFGAEQTENLLRWNNHRPKLVAQPARQELDTLAELWRAQGVEFVVAPYGAGLVANGSRPAALPGYAEGNFIIQDPAQALLVRFVAPPSGCTIYDACAAPGGKTIALGRSARVVAGEINRHRARRLAGNLIRAGQGREHVLVADARRPPLRSVDLVLLDAPCLGTGTFARHPDARWRVTPGALAGITQLQSELLESTAQVVAAGGLLVYSTCSLEPEENLQQVERFLQRHSEFHREPPGSVPASMMSAEGDLVILPQLHGMDGAYAARLRRSG